MATDIRDIDHAEAKAPGPVALATRLRSGLSLAHGRAAIEELPARLRAQLHLLADRVRRALDVPSQREIADLADRVEALSRKLDQLETEDAPAARAVSADDLRDELRAELENVVRSAREAADAAAREAAAAHVKTAAASRSESKPPRKQASASKNSGTGKAARSKPASTQKKPRKAATANKTTRKSSAE